MSTFQQDPAIASPPAPQTGCFDALDIDRFIDFDQAYNPSPLSPTSSRNKTLMTPEISASSSNNTLLPSQSGNQQNFPLPSHQYDLHKQQTGLPVGALALTSAANQPAAYSYGQQAFEAGPTDGYFGMNTADFDFNAVAGHNPSFNTNSDMDLDFDSPTQDLFMSSTTSQESATNFVDPNAIGGKEETPASTPVQSNVGRLWPGMHQQQAAMMKAQAQGQVQKPQQQARPMARPQIGSITHPRQAGHRSNGSVSKPPTDPIVEDKISQLLSQMRQSSVSSSNDGVSTPNANSQSALARQRKDEEDMDDDERLLASEEGKKLSSKERRQLRNKVSARAFRSRRKEYIGQLEGELAGKAKEADDLQAENEALRAENSRLTDLSRMLLSSSAFSTFLNELSSNGGSANSIPVAPASSTHSSSSNTQQVQQRTQKDVNPHQQQHQLQQQSGPQIGMALMPESTVDFSNLNTTRNPFSGAFDYGFNNAQVFSVTELPQGPAVDSPDFGILSGKVSNTVGSYSTEDVKDVAPVIERMPLTKEVPSEYSPSVETSDDIEFDESDPAFALFVNVPCTKSSNDVTKGYQIFGGIELEKAFARVDLVEYTGDDGTVSSATMDRFERICSALDAASERVVAIASRL